MEKESNDKLTNEQISALKPVFVIICLLGVLFAWFAYYTFHLESGWCIFWLMGYFCMCNGATNIRNVIKWPFGTQTNE